VEDSGGPIRSLLVDDDSLARLDGFVVALGEWIDGIQDAEHMGQLEEAGKRAADLAREAASLGLPPLAAAAERVVASCRAGEPLPARSEIVALTEVIRRVRMGHRSSA
jgi:hypothetical protein